ncbi:hypothetical protein CK203_064589 [Vitis vinifera]|uniref:BURP domain-containing protein n=1 Tax=Vitis vinifera TaxID=29760 RepID=A0A438FPS2_VITVI|nr:hypothetical protein CK203_064589 [Vitis vinifera]
MMLTNEVSTFTFLPSFEMLKWIRDSNDAAQYLASPSMAGSSQASSSSLLSRLLRIFLSRKTGSRFRVACWMKRAWIQQLDSQEYEFGVGMKKVADKSVVCHKMNYPYAVFYCHTFTKTRTYMIPLVGVDGSNLKPWQLVTVIHQLGTHSMWPSKCSKLSQERSQSAISFTTMPWSGFQSKNQPQASSPVALSVPS